MNPLLTRTWAEVSQEKLTYNIRSIKSCLRPNTKLLCTVKANGYGHGAVAVAETFIQAGADFLAVATIDEAIELREHHITVPILLLGYLEPSRIHEAVAYDVRMAVFSSAYAVLVDEAAKSQKKVANIHLKIDTGMGRIGYVYTDKTSKDVLEDILKITTLSSVNIEGIFTHMSCSDEEQNPYNYLQINHFKKCIDELEKHNVFIPIKHICNSSAIVNFPQVHMDMVRAGISCYGLYPAPSMKKKMDIKQAITVKSRITNVKYLEAGYGISYGKTYTLPEKQLIATVPIGYADGYTRLLSGKAQMLVRGQYVNVVGKICMDQCMIDVTNVHNINVGDEVTVIGDESTNISVDHIANLIGTINYEVVCAISQRVPRIYI